MGKEKGGPRAPPPTLLQPKLSFSCVSSTVSIDVYCFISFRPRRLLNTPDTCPL